jgi:hypothetical protein
MAKDAEIEAAVRSMRAIRTRGGKVHDEVLRAYARAALEAAELAQVAEYWRRAELRAHAAIQAAADQRGAGPMASWRYFPASCGAASRKKANRHRMTANRHPEVNPNRESRRIVARIPLAAGLKKFWLREP